MKRLLIWLAVMFVLVLSFNVLGASEEKCVAGGGTWTTPTISQGDDPTFSKKTLQPVCKCDISFYWDDTLAQCIDDSELRCGQTGGTWLNNECQCPEGTIKWTEGFGCDMPGPEPKIESEVVSSDAEAEPKLENENISYESLLFVSILLLLVIVGVIIYYFIKNKKRREKDETQ